MNNLSVLRIILMQNSTSYVMMKKRSNNKNSIDEAMSIGQSIFFQPTMGQNTLRD